jgi:MFS family permease
VLYFSLLALGVLDAAGYSVIAPVGPAIADETGAGPGILGALIAVFGIGQMLAYPIFGRAIQGVHAASVLVVSLALVVAGDLGMVLGGGLDVYFPSRFVQGIGAAGLWLGIVFATLERYPAAEAYRRLGGTFAAYSIGSILGPALGAIGGVSGPFLAHLGLVVVGVALVLLVLGRPEERPEFGSDLSTLRDPVFVAACAGVTLAAVALATLEGPLTLHFDDLLSQAEIGGLYVGMAVVVGVSAMLGGRLSPRLASVVACFLVVAGLAVAGATGTVPLWAAGLGIAAIGIGLVQTGSLGVLLEAVGTGGIVAAMVVWSQVWALGYLIGPAGSGWLAEALGFWAVVLVPVPIALLVLGPLAWTRGRRAPA